MTDPTTPDVAPEMLDVMQADRDAAADYTTEIERTLELNIRAINMRLGRLDDSAIVQAFARHRQQHTPAMPEVGEVASDFLARFADEDASHAIVRGPTGVPRSVPKFAIRAVDAALATPSAPTAAVSREDLKAFLVEAWTDFLDVNPDDLTSPDDLPDHALVTFDQMVGIVESALHAMRNPPE